MPGRTRFKRKTIPRFRKAKVKKILKGNTAGNAKKASLATFNIPLGSIVPDRLRTKLRYTQLNSVTSTSGAIVQQLFRGNSLFDPDVTGVGHQPQGFDQYMTLYQRYIVKGCAIRVHINCNTSGANYIFTVRPSADVNDTSANITVDMEKPFAKWAMGTQGTQARKIKSYYSTGKIEGATSSKVMINDTFSGDGSSSPLSQWYWFISCCNADQSTTTNFNIYSELVYYCEFYDRKTLTTS